MRSVLKIKVDKGLFQDKEEKQSTQLVDEALQRGAEAKHQWLTTQTTSFQVYPSVKPPILPGEPRLLRLHL